jgi:tRNA 2-thiouridine synthesizing protein E
MGLMKREERTWLTTGQAAELCAVTPSTVLNWIRKGRLEAVRTAGGHYRIRQTVLEPLLTDRPSSSWTSREPGAARAEPLRCWDYLSNGGVVRAECKSCIVYALRASWCFRIGMLDPEASPARLVCPVSCDDCSYFQRVMGLPTHVLVVSSDDELIRSLIGQDSEEMELRFARNAYEASTLAQVFSPSFVVLDREGSPFGNGGLLESLSNDSRLPGLKIIVAVSGGSAQSLGSEEGWASVVRVIEKPFGPDEIEAVIESFPVERAPPEEACIADPFPREGTAIIPAQHAGGGGGVVRTPPAVNDDGFLQTISSWTRESAEVLALEHDIGPLTEEHWRVIEYVQEYYDAYGKGPPVVKVHKETGLSSSEICDLFPCGMVKGAYRLAGLPRPPGCG